ncbi:hypothetical protein IAU59_006076 [Kwoniella sp. CBS 9459]
MADQANRAIYIIPTWSELSDIYPSSAAVRRERITMYSPLSSQRQRAASNLVSTFESAYGFKPSYIVRAPGRDLVLGEHYQLTPLPPSCRPESSKISFLALRHILLHEHDGCSSSKDAKGKARAVVRSSNVENIYPSAEIILSHDLFKLKMEISISDTGWDVAQTKAKGRDRYIRIAILECLSELFPNQPGPEAVSVSVSASISDVGWGGSCGIVSSRPPNEGCAETRHACKSSAAMVVGSVLKLLIASDSERGKTEERSALRLLLSTTWACGQAGRTNPQRSCAYPTHSCT